MSEVAKEREALVKLHSTATKKDRLVLEFVAHGLKVCETPDCLELECDERDGHAPTCIISGRERGPKLELIATILRDAGLLEEGR